MPLKFCDIFISDWTLSKNNYYSVCLSVNNYGLVNFLRLGAVGSLNYMLRLLLITEFVPFCFLLDILIQTQNLLINSIRKCSKLVLKWPKLTQKIDPKISKNWRNYCKNPTYDKKLGTCPQNPTAGPKPTGHLVPRCRNNFQLWQ